MAEPADYWLQGLQVGNTWAAQRSRNRESQDRRDMAQTELAARFGDDTVFGKDGKVDVFGSAAKKRIREEARIRAEAEGTLRAWDDSPIGPKPAQPAPVAPKFTPLEPGDPGMSGSQMMPSPEDFPMGLPAAAAPVAGVAAPVAAPTNRLQIPEEIAGNPYALGAFARQREQVAQERRLTAEQARRVKAEEMARQEDIYQRYGSSVVTGPDGEVDIPASAQAAEKGRQDAIRLAAIGEQAGTLGKAGPPTPEQEASADYQLGLTKGVARRTPIEARQDLAEFNAEAKKDVKEMDIQARSRIENNKIALKRELGLNAPRKMSLEDQTFVRDITHDVATKEEIASALDKNIEQLSNEEIDPYVRRQAGLNILKTLNSAEGKDAVGEGEAKRLGDFLQYQINPLKVFETGRYFGMDMPRFIQQVSLKTEELKQRAADGRVKLNEIATRNNAPSDSVVTQALVDSKPAAASTAPANPVKVNTQSEYDALPKGSKYIDSTGAIKRKK